MDLLEISPKRDGPKSAQGAAQRNPGYEANRNVVPQSSHEDGAPLLLIHSNDAHGVKYAGALLSHELDGQT